MDKYIKAQDAINAFTEYLWTPFLCSASYAKIIVDAIPAADVVPVVHGKWHDVYMTSPSSFAATCSICGISNDIPHPISAHYCPHCGAKMDGESNA